MTAAELVAALDRTLGTHGPALRDDGYAAIDRAQVRLAAGAGVIDRSATGIASFALAIPLGRYLLLGPRASAERDAPLSLDGVAVLRDPIWASAGAIELG